MAKTYATWNPADKHANITLSGGNLVATDGADAWSGVRSTIGVSTGKWYWEIVCTIRTNDWMTGIANSSQVLNDDGAQSNAYSYYSAGVDKYKVFSSNVAYGSNFVSTDIIGIALDVDGGTIEFFKNNTSQGVAFSTVTAGTWYAWWNSFQNLQVATAQFGPTLSYTPPTGYNAGLYVESAGGILVPPNLPLLGVG